MKSEMHPVRWADLRPIHRAESDWWARTGRPSTVSVCRLLGFGCMAVLMLAGCEPERQEQSKPPLRTVRHVTVMPEPDSRIRSFDGVSRAAEQARLSFRVAGTIQRLDVMVGDRTLEGEVIAVLDPSGFRLQLQQAEADRLRAQAERRNADANYERIRKLYANRSTSRKELDAARSAAESADALSQAASRAVDLAELNLSHATLKSRRDCSVAEVRADVGENVSPGQPVVEVNCGNLLEVAITVPESAVADMVPGLVGEIVFDSLPERAYSGTVSEVGVADTGAAFPVVLRLDNADGARPGLAARVNFSFRREEGAVAVLPTTSVAEDERGRFVYTVVDGGAAGLGLIRRRPVEVGALTSRGLEVTSGISPGDRVVTAGVSVVRDGMKVRIP